MRTPLDDPKAAAGARRARSAIAGSLPPGVPTDVTYGPVGGVGQAGSYYGSMFGEIGTALKQLPEKVPEPVERDHRASRATRTARSAWSAPARSAARACKLGLWNLFFLIAASLNLFIGVFNLLPLLPLDGGHIAIAWFERVRSWFARRRRRPDPGRVDYLKLMPITYAVILIFGGFTLLTIVADIVNPINIFGK